LLGSAPVPVAVFGVAPKTVSQTEWFHQWFGRDARTRTRDARAPTVRPAPERGVHAASPHAQPHAQKFSNAPANSHIEAG
jgi:hypothetical protein